MVVVVVGSAGIEALLSAEHIFVDGAVIKWHYARGGEGGQATVNTYVVCSFFIL